MPSEPSSDNYSYNNQSLEGNYYKKEEKPYDGQKYEYYVRRINVTLDNKAIKKELDKVGNFGWELVNSFSEGHTSNNYVFVFKKKRE